MATFSAALTILTLSIGLVGSLVTLYRTIRAGAATRKTLDATQSTLDATEKTLDGVVTGLELVEQTPAVKNIKNTIANVSDFTGANEELLKNLVIQTVAALRSTGLASSRDETAPEDIALAVKAVQEARADRAAKAAALVLPPVPAFTLLPTPPPKPPTPILPCLPCLPWFLLLSLSFLFLSCAPAPQRLTTEILFPANLATNQPSEIVILWPPGVRKNALYSTEVSSRTLTVSPMPVPAGISMFSIK